MQVNQTESQRGMLPDENGTQQRPCSNENGQRLSKPFGQPLPIALLFDAQEAVHRHGPNRSEKPINGQRIAADTT